ncbi:hypothetical protein KFE25_004420 [Diacronema lutheri]|uniref:Uncharacterized protein n=1 Tax=Diacronema lutheri TaxID=2081491 RepID=A0A8J6C0R3_DIALT|nr:hypothetical protein KFE25_004420 [Diacronema lutheri]
MKNDCLIGNSPQRNASTGSNSLTLEEIAEDSANVRTVVMQAGTFVGKVVSHGQVSNLNRETDSIIDVEVSSGHIVLMSRSEFKKECMSDRALVSYFEAHGLYCAMKASHQSDYEVNVKKLDNDHNLVVGGAHVPGWPSPPEGIVSAADQNAFNRRVSAFYINAKDNLKAELDRKLIKLRAEYGNMPDTEEGAKDVCYEKSAESFVHAFLSIFSPPSARVLVDNAREAGVSYKRSPAVDVLKSFVATINSYVKSRSIIWGGREFEKLQGLLYDDQARDPQAHSQHFSACRALFVQRYGKKSLFDPLLDLHLELRVLPEWPELVVIKSKYSALPCDVVTWETTDALWEEVGRCSSKRTWVRPQLLQPCSALPHDSPKQQARASGRVARVESRTEQDADASKGGHFTGKCHNCGEKGHMARECTSGVLCYNCGKKGHIASACSLPPSASRRERSRSRSPSRARSRSRPASRARTPAPQSQPTIKTGANGGGSSVRAASKTVTWKGPVAHKPSKETRSQPKEEPSKGEIAEKTATPSETTSAPPPATPEVRTLKVANASVLPTRAEGEVPIQFVKVDTGADVTGCDPRYLSEVKAEVAELSSFDGTKSKLTAKGVLGVVLADADDPSKTFELRIEAWACPGVGPVPLISMNDLLNVGVGAHLVPDGSSLDLTALGGPDIRIKGDGLVPVVRVLTGDDEDGWKTLRIHTDGGKELNSAAMEALLLEFGLSANVTSSPHTPASNGVAECAIQTLLRDTVALLAMSGLSSRHWHWAMRHACSARNKLASQRVDADGAGFVSPHELFFGRRPDLQHMVAFGSPCRVLLLGPDRLREGKTGLPSQRGHILGYGGDGVQIDGTLRLILGYVVLLRSGKIVYSRHVEIDERPLVEGGHTPFENATSAPLDTDDDDDYDAAAARDDDASALREEDDDEDDDDEDADAAASDDEQQAAEHQTDDESDIAQEEMHLLHDPMRRDRASRSKSAHAQ